MNFNVQQAKKWMEYTNNHLQDNKQYLTKLDQAIGDGDHGINMTRGFHEVVTKITSTHYESVADLMRDVAMTIISKVGGAAGPLYGTAFLKLSVAWKNQPNIDHATFTNGLKEAVVGIKQRGKSKQGEKTMIDVWDAVACYLENVDTIEAEKLKQTAYDAAEKTKEMIGTKGRAAYFKENSLGHIDPGAMSSYYLFISLCDVLDGVKNG